MTPSSGAISMSQIRTELGLSGAISLGDSDVRTYSFVPSGAISMADNYAILRLTSLSNNTMKAAAISAGWNQTTPLKCTVFQASGTASGPMSTGSTFPTNSKLAIINNGTIRGNGGFGYSGGYYAGLNGDAGTTALTMTYALTITNNGIIGGGGGSGGTGAGDGFNWGGYVGGASGTGGGNFPFATNSGQNGNASSTGLAGGTGGAAGVAGGAGTGNAGYPNGGGGGGGGLGAAGGAGGLSAFYAGGTGGAAGACTSGAGTYATWVATGTRYGTIG